MIAAASVIMPTVNEEINDKGRERDRCLCNWRNWKRKRGWRESDEKEVREDREGEMKEDKWGKEFTGFSFTLHSSFYIFQSVIFLWRLALWFWLSSVLLSLRTETRAQEEEEEEVIVALLLLMIICSLLIINLTLGLGCYIILQILGVFICGRRNLKPHFTSICLIVAASTFFHT